MVKQSRVTKSQAFSWFLRVSGTSLRSRAKLCRVHSTCLASPSVHQNPATIEGLHPRARGRLSRIEGAFPCLFAALQGSKVPSGLSTTGGQNHEPITRRASVVHCLSRVCPVRGDAHRTAWSS